MKDIALLYNGRGAAWRVEINVAWHGRGTAWVQHGMCELAFNGFLRGCETFVEIKECQR
jgi:hypothetical protein